MKNRIFILLFSLSIVFTGCQKPQVKPQYNKKLPPGELALRKITDPENIPDFTYGCHDMSRMVTAIDRSLNYLEKPSSRQFFPYAGISRQKAVNSLKAFKKLIQSGLRGSDLNNAIRRNFDVYMSVGCDDKGTILFTGYYTPIFQASYSKTPRFKYPLYKQPEDLVKGSRGQILGRRKPSGSITEYPARAQIQNSNMLKGKELVWLKDPFEVYIAHVQGSAKLKMPDGRLITVSYTASNGREYKSIANTLIRQGKIEPEKLSLSTLINYFDNHPEQVDNYTRMNPRFVFFHKSDGPPRGSLNEPVTRLRTIATDKSIYPRACLAFISTKLPDMLNNRVYQGRFKGFVLDQDTGGAIRAPGRCDLYMGIGDKAGKLAGYTYQEGKLYYLFLKKNRPIVADSVLNTDN